MLEFAGFELNVLTLITLLPLVGAVMVWLLTADNPNLARGLGLAFTVPVLVLAIGVFYSTWEADLGPNEYAFQSQTEWFSLLGASWHVGVDGVSASMVLLTAILTPLAMLIAFEHTDRPHTLMALFLFMQTGMFGVFVALDMLIFFLFYEIGLVPMYFIIYLWGGENRDAASRKFFIYTMAGSLGLLLAMQLIAVVVGREVNNGNPTFDIPTWLEVWPQLTLESEILGFAPAAVKWFALLGFTLAFALKIPIFPLHTWLPDAHTEAPTAGSMLLAGVLLKLGAYGFLRLVIPLFPLEWTELRTPTIPLLNLELEFLQFQAVQALALLATLSIVFGAFSAWAQDDFKKLVAYSSVNHMGFVAMGLAVFAAVYGSTFAYSMNTPERAELRL
ncbi:MAG: NADH-quinone oxidoreductase subunit M [Anaerolineae bacterium]|nr:NADH-quinone oxidoreductase subunit M [Anaerolineae bacterium]